MSDVRLDLPTTARAPFAAMLCKKALDSGDQEGAQWASQRLNWVAEAKGRGENLSVDEVAAEMSTGDAVLVDLREPEELTTYGAVRQATACANAGSSAAAPGRRPSAVKATDR
ncbi:MAG: hypothetical protein M3517_09215 [Actinomycetota bacterium]|nr:hypothetical protein [Actinomycetota bacterium]